MAQLRLLLEKSANELRVQSEVRLEALDGLAVHLTSLV